MTLYPQNFLNFQAWVRVRRLIDKLEKTDVFLKTYSTDTCCSREEKKQKKNRKNCLKLSNNETK